MLFLTRSNLLAVVSLAVGSARADAGPTDPMTALINTLSNECAVSAVQLLGSDFATCGDAMDSMAAIAAQSDLPANLTVWFNNICKTACSSETLSDARSIVTKGCPEDLKDPTSLPLRTTGAIDNYGSLRHGACAFDINTHRNCLVDFATTFEKYSHKSLTVKFFVELPDNVASLSVIPPTELCSDCNKVLYTLSYNLLRNSPEEQNALKTEATALCPPSFTDGTDPSTVTFVGETPRPASNSSPPASGNGSCPDGSSAASSGCSKSNSQTTMTASGTSSTGSRRYCSSSPVGGATFVVFALVGGLFAL
ncbi:BQ2448_4647 [Microbotryum intermedium]|uniref:BQ2448_4647 protein n=1 Tax=Microbotryum intermedium TaxID=269621 RepID=A0A238FIX5_9BASI|nr:BQ2448_4647 [Microbotryum intermedium]